MTLQASGEIDVDDINAELGNSAGALFSFDSAQSRNLAEVASGAISLSNFYSKTAGGSPVALVDTWYSTTQTNGTQITVTLPSHSDGDTLLIYVGEEVGNAAFTTPSGWQAVISGADSKTSFAVFSKVASSEPSTVAVTSDTTGDIGAASAAFSDAVTITADSDIGTVQSSTGGTFNYLEAGTGISITADSAAMYFGFSSAQNASTIEYQESTNGAAILNPIVEDNGNFQIFIADANEAAAGGGANNYGWIFHAPELQNFFWLANMVSIRLENS